LEKFSRAPRLFSIHIFIPSGIIDNSVYPHRNAAKITGENISKTVAKAIWIAAIAATTIPNRQALV